MDLKLCSGIKVSIHIVTDVLQEIKSRCKTNRETHHRFLLLFLHEMAHFKFKEDEQKTEKTARRIFKLLTD